MEKWAKLREEPNYEISESGAIRHLDRGFSKTFRIGSKGKYLMFIVDGRPTTIRRRYRVHRLVAKYFIPNPSNYPHVNHLDGNKHNNHASNLEWCTPEMNNAHAKALGIGGSNK